MLFFKNDNISVNKIMFLHISPQILATPLFTTIYFKFISIVSTVVMVITDITLWDASPIVARELTVT